MRGRDAASDAKASIGDVKKSMEIRAFEEEELEFHRMRNSRRLDEILEDRNDSLVVTTPPQLPLIEIFDESLVVGQEISLTAIFLAVHKEIVRDESEGPGEYLSQKLSLAMLTVYATLLLVVYYNWQSSAREHRRWQRRKKAIVRLSDGLLLAAILRLLSGALRALTASYAADTVHALAIGGMAVHLLACDYGYANGAPPSPEAAGGGGGGARGDASRPAFLGGTVSLNAVFFSTVLLASRIRSDATSYAFVSSVVTLFAFYPASRHNIAGHYPNNICEFFARMFWRS